MPESEPTTESRRQDRADGDQEDRMLEATIGRKEVRRLEAIEHPARSVWFGLGMFGLVGWSVAAPALIGVFIGAWIDSRWPGPYSWTLMLLVAGITIGCVNAWSWVRKEARLDTKGKTKDGD